MVTSNPRTWVAEVGLLLYPGCHMAMVQGMSDLLQTASDFSLARGGSELRVSHWSRGERGEFSRSYDSQPGIEHCPEVLVIPGRLSGPLEGEDAEPFASWLVEKHSQGSVLASNCGGAFLLAATGLLNNRAATTHWLFADRFRAAFPSVHLDADKIVIEDGDIITAGGLMSWTDLAMRVVGRLLGPTVMVETGQFWLVDPAGREQRHYSSFAPRLNHGYTAILKVQHWLNADPARQIQVEDMARHAGLEIRTFLRHFKAATGMRPIEYVQNLRMAKARELLQYTQDSVDQISWSVGYEDPAAFRRQFHRTMGLAPRDYRRRFGARGNAQDLIGGFEPSREAEVA